MPAELRHLLFPPAEVVEAVKEYHRRLGTLLPTGRIVQCGPEDQDAHGGTVRFRIKITPNPAKGAASSSFDGEMQREVVIEPHVLTAALILYCRDRLIPLPATASKSLQRFGTQVCLVATINSKLDKMQIGRAHV